MKRIFAHQAWVSMALLLLFDFNIMVEYEMPDINDNKFLLIYLYMVDIKLYTNYLFA